ncbi:MAG: class I SAM-dependent methyltransferase [Cyanobacteria bacterium RM1_2_2]|nr:class I SAM-dependent methyltransferase [Cyanobacteria bacterium RM1_2_2]
MSTDTNPGQLTWDDQEKIRQQFDSGPYPRIPLEAFPKDDYEKFFTHSIVTAHYLRHRKVISPEKKLILDAGCGSGYKSLVLAAANPGAKVIGVDLSEQSVKLAQQRLQHHGLAENVEFYQLSLYDIAQLGLEFDYINCDEVLYLLPDPAAGLQAMRSVLKPDGIIRANLHNSYQRSQFYRAQSLFKLVGLMNTAPGEFEQGIVLETLHTLKSMTKLKEETWERGNMGRHSPEKLEEVLGANFLLLGDKGYTIPQLFDYLKQADLEFVSMVNWRHWEVADLFQEPDNLPLFWSMCLAEASIQERLHLYELLHPVNRLMDFWCAHPGMAVAGVDEWDEATWRTAVVHLHPHLQFEALKETLINCIRAGKPFEISQPIQLPTLAPVFLEASIAACLLPLWESAQPIQAIIERYRQMRPVDPVTLEPIGETQAFAAVKDLLNRLDAFLYVLIESP